MTEDLFPSFSQLEVIIPLFHQYVFVVYWLHMTANASGFCCFRAAFHVPSSVLVTEKIPQSHIREIIDVLSTCSKVETHLAAMESLPDEVMLLILSNIEDAFTLLDAVPLVCKRWQQLVGDPRAWAGVHLWVGGCMSCSHRLEPVDHQPLFEAARALLHAPAVGCLHLDWRFEQADDFFARGCGHRDRISAAIFSALRRSQAVVRELHLPNESHVDQECADEQLHSLDASRRADVLGFVLRSRKSLRVINFGQLLSWAQVGQDLVSIDVEEDDQPASQSGSQPGSQAGGQPRGQMRSVVGVLGVLAELQRLEALSVQVWPMEQLQQLQQAEEVGVALPRLRRLTLTVLPEFWASESCEALLAGLLRGCAGSLHHLRVKSGSWPLPRALLPHLQRCSELRSARLAITDMTALRDMRHLHSLRLDLRSDEDYEVYGSDQHARQLLAGVASQLRYWEPLPSLRSLRLTTNFFDTQSEWFREYRALLGDLVVAAGRLAANATELCVDCCRALPEPSRQLPGAMPALRSVDLGTCFTEHVEAALELQQLDEVAAYVGCREDQEWDHAFSVVINSRQRLQRAGILDGIKFNQGSKVLV